MLSILPPFRKVRERMGHPCMSGGWKLAFLHKGYKGEFLWVQTKK
jgi:hypothetical protein